MAADSFEENPPVSVTAVIIGRAGSKGLPGKNAMALLGRPMVSYSIEAARESEAVTRLIVSTDCAEMRRAAEREGVEVIQRPESLATDSATVDAAVRHAVESDNAPFVVILYANAPVRPRGLIDRAVRMLIESRADSVQSYAGVGKYHPYWESRIDEEGRVTPFIENQVYRRQDLPPLFIPDGGVIVVRREALLNAEPSEPHSFLGRDRRGILNEPGAVVDIDTKADLVLAEIRLREHSAELGASRH
ncbi:MAG: cytidylyltransferase domain-containing protein [Phycisphaerales bacterium]